MTEEPKIYYCQEFIDLSMDVKNCTSAKLIEHMKSCTNEACKATLEAMEKIKNEQ